MKKKKGKSLNVKTFDGNHVLMLSGVNCLIFGVKKLN